jgi:DNA-binding PadR family transcriptional regulator
MNRHLSTLDLLLLIAVESGIVTPYALLVTSGLSVGATIPALKRLSERGFLTKGEPESRGRQEFRLTARGKQQLAKLSQALATLPSSELNETESLVRALALAVYCGDEAIFQKLAQESEQKRHERLAASHSAVEDTPKPGDTVALYRWMLARVAAAKLQAEGRQMGRIQQVLIEQLKNRS